jgi:hypothetical protein
MIEQRYGTIPLAASQGKTLLSNGKREFVFYCILSPGKYTDSKITINNGEGYDSLEEALMTIPLSKATSVDEMRQMIARDFGLGLGKVYEDFNIVAYVGSYHTTKPLAWYTHEGKTKYVKHPQIDLMVQRYEESK